MAPNKSRSETIGSGGSGGSGGEASQGGGGGGGGDSARAQPTSARSAATSGKAPPQSGGAARATYSRPRPADTGAGNGGTNGTSFTATSGGAGTSNGGRGRSAVGESLIDATAYPLLTEQINPSARTGGFGGGGDRLTDFAQTVNTALQAVLGWQPRENDARGFTGALSQSFDLRDVEGHVEWSWTPRTYAVQTDLAGGITGAQASLLTRAKQAVDASLPLLDGLYPLSVEADPEDSAALRSLVRGQMLELVNELGTLGGPRVARVDEIFALLLGRRAGAGLTGTASSGADPTSPDPAATPPGGPMPAPTARVTLAEGLRLQFRGPSEIEGTLGLMRGLFGLGSGKFVNTVDEEQDLTNFRILADYLIGLERSWLENRQFFTRSQGKTPFFGTQLVLLSRQLSVIGESVGEVRFSLDSVFIGPLERQTLLVVPRTFCQTPNGDGGDFVGPPPALDVVGELSRTTTGQGTVVARDVTWWVRLHDELFVEELLSWIEGFAGKEGPGLIQNGGKLGVERIFTPTASRLYLLTLGMLCPDNPEQLPEGFFTARVRRSFHELAMQLGQLVRLSKHIKHRVELEF
jgi:hypothetical protein